MSSTITKMILIGVSVILTCVLILYAVSLTSIGSEYMRAFANSVNEKNNTIAESQYTKYENGLNTGSDVVSAIRRFRDELVITVVVYDAPTSTKTLVTGTNFTGSIQNLPTSPEYVNPNATFGCETVTSQNGVITGLVFKQVAYVSNASTTAGGSVNQANSGGTVMTGNAESFKNLARQDDREENTSDEGDLDIEFSDENEKTNNNTEVSAVVDSLATAVSNYSSQLNDLTKNLSKKSYSELATVLKSLSTLNTNVVSLIGQCETANLSKKDKSKFVIEFEELSQSIMSAMDSVSAMQKEIKKKEDTATAWYVGYPVRESVKATLTNGVLTFSGEGDCDTGHDLPKWLKQSQAIESVVFKSGVTPKSIDYWFSDCKNLKTVEGFPKSVESMNGTFSECISLRGVLDLTKNRVTAMNAFRNCSKDAEVLTAKVKKDSSTAKELKEYVKLNDNCNIRIEEV